MDYRNAIKWYQYDPTKWFIWVAHKLNLASHLKVCSIQSFGTRQPLTKIRSLQTFPDNEVAKGQLTMQLKRLRQTQDGLTWPQDTTDLPVISWQSCTSFYPLVSTSVADSKSFW